MKRPPRAIGRRVHAAAIFDGRLADIHFLDGTALTDAEVAAAFVTDFAAGGGAYRAPAAVTGLTYGANGYHLDFADAANPGADVRGGDDWTPSGFGVGDQAADVPGAPYAVWNALYEGAATVSEGGRAANGAARSTLFMLETVFYWEITATGGGLTAGVVSEDGSATAAAVANGATVGFRFDANAGLLEITTDGASFALVASGLLGGRFVYAAGGPSSVAFDESEFVFAQPAGAKPLRAASLSTPRFHGGDWFNALSVLGDGLYPRTVTGAGFTPDMVEIKARDGAFAWNVNDRLRGFDPASNLAYDVAFEEGRYADNFAIAETTVDGFTLNAPAALDAQNSANVRHAAYVWRAGDAGAANNHGSIPSMVSVAAARHFSIVLFTGDGQAGATIGHGLNDPPEIIRVKSLDTAQSWIVYGPNGTLDPETDFYFLDRDNAAADELTAWNDTAPTNDVFSVGSAVTVNELNTQYLAHCMRSIPGLSKVGLYYGTGSFDGAYVYCGFAPKMISINLSMSDRGLYTTKRVIYKTQLLIRSTMTGLTAKIHRLLVSIS